MITVKTLLSPRGAYLTLGIKKRGLIREGGLIERGGGAYFKSQILKKINFITKTEQEMGLCMTVLQMQRHLYPNSDSSDHVSIQSD